MCVCIIIYSSPIRYRGFWCTQPEILWDRCTVGGAVCLQPSFMNNLSQMSDDVTSFICLSQYSGFSTGVQIIKVDAAGISYSHLLVV